MRWLKILAVQSIIALVLAEVLLRTYNPLPFRLRGDAIVLPAGFRYQRTNAPGPKFDPVTIHTRNRLGFRGPDLPDDFASRVSIVAVGGSTTECFPLSDGKSWPEVMGAELAKTRADLWVNNAGFDGHSTFGHLVLLRSVLVTLRPTVMLVLAGVNDIGLDWVEPNDEFEAPDPRTQRIWHRLARHSEVANTALNLVRAWRASRMTFGGDQPLDFASLRRFSMTDDEIAAAVAPFARYLDSYDSRLSALARDSRAAGIEPVFLTQPALVGGGVDPSTGLDLTTLAGDGDQNGLADWRLLEMYNDVMRGNAARNGVFLIDLAHRLPKDSRFFYDFIHFSNDGAREVGQIVAAALGPHLVR